MIKNDYVIYATDKDGSFIAFIRTFTTELTVVKDIVKTMKTTLPFHTWEYSNEDWTLHDKTVYYQDSLI